LTDIVFRGGYVPDGEPEYESPVQCGAGEERPAAGVDALQQIVVLLIGTSVAETN